MTYPLRGIVEGFYGSPWTHEDRLDILAFMHVRGLNAYTYAPKDDELLRDNWRAPYDADSLARFRTLAEAARKQNIIFTFAMSPGLDLAYSDDNDVEALLAKVQPLLALGVPSLGIFFDDVPPSLNNPADRARYADLGEAQADFLARVQARLPDVHLMTVPTFYCGEPGIPYLHSLAKTPEQVDIMWTGPAICSREVRSEHMRDVADVLRRPAVLWDNYPVNDAGMIAELHIGPYRLRDSNLPVRGIYANPMSLVQASKLPLATFADFAADMNWYSADASWKKAADELVGEALTDALAVFAESITISPLRPEQPQAMLDLIAPFNENRLPYTPNPAPAHLRTGTARMRAAHDQLVHAVDDVPLLAEIEPWLAEYGHWIGLLETIGEYIELVWGGENEETPNVTRQQAADTAREQIRIGLKEAVDFRTVTCGNVIPNFIQDLLRKTGDPLV